MSNLRKEYISQEWNLEYIYIYFVRQFTVTTEDIALLHQLEDFMEEFSLIQQKVNIGEEQIVAVNTERKRQNQTNAFDFNNLEEAYDTVPHTGLFELRNTPKHKKISKNPERYI